MRKALLLLITTLLLVNTTLVKAQLTATGNDSIDVLCNGDISGYASVEVTGGVMPYTYLWMPGGENTQINGPVSAGTYTITVTDNASNTSTASVTITQPATALNVTTTSTSATCIFDNGTATGMPSGGTGPYTYSWSDASTQTNQTATGLSAGTYSVIVTDNNGCNLVASATVASSSGITISINPVVDVACNGGATGSAKADPSGGTSPYTYSWSDAQSNQTATGLTAGTYTVTVKDNNNCSTQDVITITQPPPLTANISSSTNPVCNGAATGSATVTAGGGTTPYTYLWNPTGKSTQTVTGLSAGSYTVTVKDKHNCSITATVTITQPPPVSGTFTTMPVACNGGSTGSATVTGTGGTPPYTTYVWSTTPTQSGITAIGLSMGTYTVTITDNAGCTGTASVTITQPPPLTVSITPTYPQCNGQPGTALANPGGGTPVYTYSWAPSGGSGITGTGLTAGDYTVTVTDNNDCVATASITITQPPVLTATMGASTNVLCNGGATGTATVSAGGGTPTYIYLWTPAGGSNAIGTGLSVGTFTVTVTDTHGCTATASVAITQPPPLTASMGTPTDPTCNGGTGTATVTAGGGTIPYTYLWAPNGGNTSTGTGLTAGGYTVTVTDNNGCTATASVTITQPTPVSGTFTTTPATCGNSNGSATVTGTGGTAPYTHYLWNPTGQTTQTATGLSVGTYTVTITDNNGCTGTASVAITQPTTLTATMGVPTDPHCNAGTGTATVTAAGGITPYTYLWNPNGGSGSTGTGLTAGNYTVTVTDNSNCTATASVTITQPTPVTATVSGLTYPACNGGVGSGTVTGGGGSLPYTYLWIPTSGTNPTETNLPANSYTVTVTDNNNCTATALVVITQPAIVSGTFTTTGALCAGGATGSATVTGTGGTTPYTNYLWNPTSQSTQTATGLSAGSYTVTITDNNGCTGTASVTVTQPLALGATTSFTQASCNLFNGSATVHATDGTNPYTYSWNPSGQTNATASNISAGNYTVTVTDNSECTITASVTVTQPSAVTAIIGTTTGVSCNGGSNGTTTVNAGGGTSPYTYLWNPLGGSDATGIGLSAGNYTVTVTDNNGCVSTASVTITQPNPMSATLSSTPENCNTLNGMATVNTVSGGTSPYVYSWSPSAQTNATATGLASGTYTVTITDHGGCQITATVLVANTSSLNITSTSTTNLLCNGTTDGSATVNVSGGVSPYTYDWTTVPAQTNATATGLSAGTYTINVTDNAGCTQFAVVTITQPATAISLNTSSTPSGCSNNTGTATVNASGGTPGYNYLWSNSGTTSSITGLGSGTFTLTVTDANGCTATTTCTVGSVGGVTGFITSSNVSCFGGNNGSATATITTGAAPYTYSWAPIVNNTPSITGLSAGSYTLTVHDVNGCLFTQTVIITSPASALSATLSSTPENCNTLTGAATANASGGTVPYTYSWSPSAQTNATATGLAAGTYTVTITDNNGCTLIQTETVNNTSSLSISASGTNILCNGANDGMATVVAGGGVSPYTYAWTSSAQTNATATGLSAGSYTINVTDNAGCTQFAVVTLTQPATSISLNTSSTPSGCSNNTGTATVSANGGTPGYTYLWSNGGTTATITGVGSGTFTTAVTDANGCTKSTVCNVSSNGGVTGFIATTNVSCFGNNTGTATAYITTGAPPYTYLWAPVVSSTSSISGLSAGSYSLTVQDANGCLFIETVIVAGPISALAAATTTTNSSCNSTNDGSITLTVSGGSPHYTFVWSPNNSTTQNDSNIVSGIYTVIITDSNGCTLTTSATVGANSTVLAAAGRDTVLCRTNTVVALNGTSSVNATSYQWYQMPGMVALGTDTSVVFVRPSAGINAYELVVKNGLCSDTSHDTIVVASASANAGPDQEIFGAGNVSIGGTPTALSGSTCSWSPGNPTLNDSLLTNPTATPTVTTVYTVTVHNSYGCMASDTVTVFVYAGVTVPSGFSPNGDGVNDTWVLPFSGDFPNIIVEVYNRWGELLYHSDGYPVPWNGLYDNKILPIGTYYYIITLNDPRFPKALTGPVTILR